MTGPSLPAPLVGPEGAPAAPSEPAWPAALRVAAGFAAVSASVALGIAQWALGDASAPFVRHNNADPMTRALVLTWVLAAAVLPVLVTLVIFVRRRAPGVPRLERAFRLASPLLLTWTVPALFDRGMASDKPVRYLLFVAATVLALERLLRLAFASVPEEWGGVAGRVGARLSARVRRNVPFLVVLLAGTGYGAYASYYTVLEHWRFQTFGYDLGIYTSMLQNFLAGHWFRSTVLNPQISYLAHHAELGTLYLVPLYALLPRAETLLVLQSFALGLAAVPLYLFASSHVPRPSAALVALAYLMFAPLHGPNFYDFHWMPMTVPVWFVIFWALSRRKQWLVAVMALVVLPMRDEAGFFLGAFGAYLVGTATWPRMGIGFFLAGIGWTLLMRLVVTPAHGDAGFEGYYKDLIVPGMRGFGAVAATLLSNPSFVWTTLATEEKLLFVLHLVGPLAFLPLRRVASLWLLLPGSLFTLFTAGYPPPISVAFQYTTHLIPWLFFGLVLALGHPQVPEAARRPFRRSAVLAMVLGVAAHGYVFGALFQQPSFHGGFHRVTFGMTDGERVRYRNFLTLQALVPQGASVAATDAQSPHFGAWTTICTLRITHCNAEYLFLARSLTGEERRNVRAALDRTPYGLVASNKDFYVLKEGHEAAGTAGALRELGFSGGR